MSKAFVFVCSFLLITSMAFATPSVEEGKSIFSTRCTSCHNVNKDLVGPALAGIDQRKPVDWLIKFVHSSQSVIKSGDPYATTLFNKFNHILMPDHSDLTDENIKSIVEYIKSEAKEVSDEKPPFAKPGKLRPNYLPLSASQNLFFFAGFLALVAIVAGVMYFAVEVKILQRKQAGEV